MIGIQARTAASVTLPVGGLWVMEATVTDADGVAVDAVPVWTITLPDGSTATPTVTTVATGAYRVAYELASDGRYLASAIPAGTYGVAVWTAEALEVTATEDDIDEDDIDEYLGEHSWDMSTLTEVLTAERQAQRDVCTIPATIPASLTEALKRRVAVNLARRSLPLGAVETESGSVMLPGRDGEVRRLEAPYRKRIVG